MNDVSALMTPEEEAVFSWVHVHNKDELEAFYRSILPKLREAARACGYALGVHGSMRRDLDLIAAPWVADHADKEALARALHRAACGYVQKEGYRWGVHDPKPCGRIGTVFPVCWTEWNETSAGHIDLAVMPDTSRPELSRGENDG